MQRRCVDARPGRHARAGEALLKFDPEPRSFDHETLDLLATETEVVIETTRPDGTQRRTRIWIVVDGADVFVRSVRGDRGHWYQSALDNPDAVAIAVGKRSSARTVPARARLANDPTSIERCSAALSTKYALDPSLRTTLRPHTLETTLRLEPR